LGIVRDAVTLLKPRAGVSGVRSCEIAFHDSAPVAPATATKIWPVLWVSTLCPAPSVSTLA
jgi:hypothetical protein